jgi:hypothetical protein
MILLPLIPGKEPFTGTLPILGVQYSAPAFFCRKFPLSESVFLKGYDDNYGINDHDSGQKEA